MTWTSVQVLKNIMTTQPVQDRYNDKTTIDIKDFTGLEISDRTTSIDFKAMRQKANALLGEKWAVAFAAKCSLQGINCKQDDYVKIGQEKKMCVDLLAILQGQKGYKDNGNTLGRDSSKELVSIVRLVRAHAANVSLLIDKQLVKPAMEFEKLAQKAGLPIKYAFLNSCYGMDDATLTRLAQPYFSFCVGFDNIIEEAYAEGWAKGSNKRSHADAAESYIKFRGIDTSSVQ